MKVFGRIQPFDRSWPVPRAVELACILEAAAPKLGNVHPAAGFGDMHFGHFVASAFAISPVFESAASKRVGELVHGAVSATRTMVGCNTNLGTILLLAPLAKAAGLLSQTGSKIDFQELARSTKQVLLALGADDGRDIYAAIRLAAPGGLGSQAEDDVRAGAPGDLIVAMGRVAEFDAVARQYVHGFKDVFERLVPWFSEELTREPDPMRAIVRLQLRWMAMEPDGLIIRKLGWKEAEEIRDRASLLLGVALSCSGNFSEEFQSFDHHLRSDGSSRNPGTTADLIAATLFCYLLVDRRGTE